MSDYVELDVEACKALFSKHAKAMEDELKEMRISPDDYVNILAIMGVGMAVVYGRYAYKSLDELQDTIRKLWHADN